MKLTPPTSSRERFVLVLGIASSACLAVAAFAAFGSAREAGWSRLNDLSTSIRGNVRSAWTVVTADVLHDSDPVCIEPASAIVNWTSAQAGEAPQPVQPIAPVASPTLTVFDALFAESERAELVRADLSEALSLAEEAMIKEASAAWLAQARLRTIQLATKLDRKDTVRAHWGEARAQVDPHVVTGDISTLLLCLLAALPSIEPAERQAAAGPVVALWTSDQLPLPGPPPELERGVHGFYAFEIPTDPRESALRSLLMAACGSPLEWNFGALDDQRRREALRAMIGKVPVDIPADATGWTLFPAGAELLAVRSGPPGTFRGHILLRSSLQRALQDELEERRALPEGFRLDMSGNQTDLGEPVGAWMDFGPAFPRVTVRHPDVGSILRGAEARTLWLRTGLIVLALFVAGASITTAFALRRERRLVEARTSFVASVSHELRTPLASILLMAENLENGRAGANLERYHAAIKREALRLRRLVDDVLDFARLERGKRFEPHIEDVDAHAWFDAVAAEAAGLARQESASREAQVTCTNDPLPRHGAFDREAVRRAVLNLVDNALRHSGSPTVTLHARQRQDGSLSISVSDRGKGIPSRHRAAVFDPFTRLAGSENTPGAGLGLAIVREIAEAHAGAVSVRDLADGPGIEFELVIPLGERPPLPLEAAS